MRKLETVEEMQTITRIHSIFCDKCKREVGAKDECNFDRQEMLTINISCGYGSILGDGNEYSVDLCQQCVKNVLGPYLQFKRNLIWDGYIE